MVLKGEQHSKVKIIKYLTKTTNRFSIQILKNHLHFCKTKNSDHLLNTIVDQKFCDFAAQTGVGCFHEDQHLGVYPEPGSGAVIVGHLWQPGRTIQHCTADIRMRTRISSHQAKNTILVNSQYNRPTIYLPLSYNYTVENKNMRNYRTTVKQGKQLLSTLGISHSVHSTIKKR